MQFPSSRVCVFVCRSFRFRLKSFALDVSRLSLCAARGDLLALQMKHSPIFITDNNVIYDFQRLEE